MTYALAAREDGPARRVRHLRRPRPDRGPDPAGRERPHQHRRSPAAPTRSTRPRCVANFINNPNNRSYQPRALRERVHDSRADLPVHAVGPAGAAAAASPRRRPTSAARDATCSCAASRTRSPRSSRTRTRRARRSSSASSRSCSARRQRHRRAEPVRRGGLQDQRRPRQLQRDAAVARPPLQPRPDAERAVHAGARATATRPDRTRR